MKIGIPCEILPLEKRVATVPEVVEKLMQLGFSVAVESGAGEAAHFDDDGLPRVGGRGAARCGHAVGSVGHRAQGAPAQRRRGGADAPRHHADWLYLARAKPRADGSSWQAKQATVLAIDCLPRTL